MIGIALVAVAEIFAEISTSLGKREVSSKKESLYAFGFLSAFWSTFILLFIGIFIRHEFVFSLASLPTFLLRAVLEVALVFTSLNAILQADRSTFAFLRTLTIPILLAVDLVLGFSISTMQMLGMGIILFTAFALAFNHDLSPRGKLLSLISAMIAVCTISLYKYNITHFNSVEAEQAFMHIILLVVLVITAYARGHENVFRSLFHPIFLVQSFAAGIASTLISFAYLFAPASVIATSHRSLGILASIVSGRVYFHETHVAAKILACILIVAGIALTVAG